jgi:hypothetical protein
VAEQLPPTPEFPALGVFHGTELGMFFPALFNLTLSGGLATLAEEMQSSVVGFVADLDPNSALSGAYFLTDRR